jgi:hypothetical protein
VGALAGHLKGGDSVEQWRGRSGAAPHGVEVGEGVTPRVSKSHDYANHMFMRL